MSESRFMFVENVVLRRNLAQAFDHIVTLLPFTESDDYHEEAKSAFRKTMIIYTSSIIEALLFYLLDSEFSENDLHGYEWKLQNKKVLHKVRLDHEIVAGDYKKVVVKNNKEKMNLGQISKFLKCQSIINDSLYKKVDNVRRLRNDQHIGTHKRVKSYSKSDLEKAFEAASSTMSFVKSYTEK